MLTDAQQLELRRKLEAWLASSETYAAIGVADSRARFRKGTKICNEGERRPSIDLQAISRESREQNFYVDPSVKSTGFMASYIDVVEAVAKDHGFVVYIESVINEFLMRWFERRGYYVVGPYASDSVWEMSFLGPRDALLVRESDV